MDSAEMAVGSALGALVAALLGVTTAPIIGIVK